MPLESETLPRIFLWPRANLVLVACLGTQAVRTDPEVFCQEKVISMKRRECERTTQSDSQ